MKFEIGEKVKWIIGQGERLIINKALFLEELEGGECEVQLYESRGISSITKMKIELSLLERDN